MARTTVPMPETEEGKTFFQQTPVVNAPLIANGDVNEIREPVDQFSLKQRSREKYGILPHEDHGWIRNPKYWEAHEMKDRADEWMSQEHEDGTRRVILVDGKPVTNGDLILVAKPKEEREREDAIAERETEEYLENIEGGNLADIPRWRSDREAIEDLAHAQHRQNIAAGLIGPTAGMDFDVVARQYGRERMEKEMAFHRNGGRHVDATPRQEDFQARQEERGGRERTSVGYNKKLAENWPADMRRK